MLDIKLFRDNPSLIKESEKRRFKDPKLVDEVLKYDKLWRNEIAKLSKLRSMRNTVSKEINQLKKSGKSANTKIKAMRDTSEKISKIDVKAKKYLRTRDELRYKVGNILDETVPIARDESGNVIIRKWGKPTKFRFKPKHQADLINIIDGADLDRASKYSGSRFYYLKNELAMLNLALMKYGMDKLSKAGFTPMTTPVMLRHAPMKAAAELCDFEEQLYKIEGEDAFLIATSEQTLAVYHMNEVLTYKDLPKAYSAYSLCFRKEAGSHGKDTKGIFRVHQFDKIEQYVFCHPKDSKKWHEKMIKLTEDLFKGLEIPYQVVNIASGDMNDNGSKKYDIKGWFPAQNTYRELCSGTNCIDYQARKLNVKFDDKDGSRKIVHTLNCTALATERTIACLIENHQNKDGSINIPKALRKYTGFKTIKPK